MRDLRLVHRGHVLAAGFIVDVPTIGEAEARRRVLDILQASDRLLALPDERWVLVAASPRLVDTRHAPGIVLVRQGDELIAAPGPAMTGDLLEYRFGALTAVSLAGLAPVDHASWFDLGQLLELRPLHRDDVPVPATTAPPPEPDLRARANLGAPDERATAMMRELHHLAQQAAEKTAGSQPSGRGRGQGATGVRPPPQKVRSAVARLVLRSPAAGVVGRKHARYIEELTQQFRTGDLTEALHRAIPLGSETAAALSLKLPQRRDQLRVTGPSNGGRSVPYGATIHQHLREIYRQAATDLEARGEIAKAAFVLAELLNDIPGCVVLLERHRHYIQAAELAQARNLEPGLIVRLWWLAKDTDRAIAVARRHGAFADAITRLDKVDPAAADDLRVAWTADLERAGDLVGAIEAAWPREHLRPLLVNIIRRGERLGGPAGGIILAYALAHEATDERLARALEILHQRDDPTGEAAGFITAFAAVPAASRTIDRRLATAHLRANPIAVDDDRPGQRVWQQIRDRADPALVADLPKGRPPRSPAVTPLHLPHLAPGQLVIHDAAALANGDVLVALGPLGCRLLHRNGHLAAEWHQPTNRLVLADHGGSALLLDQRPNNELDVRRLDLTTRKLTAYGTMHLAWYADSFDGTNWIVIDRANAAIVNLAAAAPTIAWRPLEPRTQCHALLRTPTEVTALVTEDTGAASGPSTLVFTWNPTMSALTRRRIVHFADDVSGYRLIPHGMATWRGANLELDLPDGTRRIALGTDQTAWTVGNLLAIAERDTDRQVLRIERLRDRSDVLRHDIPTDSNVPTIRSHGNTTTLWDEQRRVWAIDLDRATLTTSLRTMA